MNNFKLEGNLIQGLDSKEKFSCRSEIM